MTIVEFVGIVGMLLLQLFGNTPVAPGPEPIPPAPVVEIQGP